jgi:tetratricopeptide (TPR) repeat protein
MMSDSGDVAALIRAGEEHLRAGRAEQARAALEKALAIKPDDTRLGLMLAQALSSLDRLDDAIRILRRTVELDPNSVDAESQLALLLGRSGEIEEALQHAQAGLKLAPEDPRLIMSYANLLTDCRRPEASLAVIDELLRRNPRDAHAHYIRGYFLLSLGRLVDGYREWEWRFLMYGQTQPHRVPKWEGSDPAGRTILVHAEQGLGDTIQMIRYAPLLRDRGAKVIVQCQPTLVDLMLSVPGVSLVRPFGAPLPQHDLWTPAMSLPYCFGTTLETIPHEVPYLRADPRRIEKFAHHFAEATAAGKKKIGLAWACNPRQARSRTRICPPDALTPLADLAGADGRVALFSLQKPPAPPLTEPLSSLVTDLSPSLADMSDTAAAMMHLDMIITIDTSIAHLAGALARPVWTMLSYSPDCKFLLEGDRMRWYPTMRLFRQDRPGGWDSVVQKLKESLETTS